MKKALILFGKKKWEEEVFTDDSYKYSYELMYETFYKNDIKLYRASYQWFNDENKIFSHAWSFKNGKWIRCKNIKPDVIFDKLTSEKRCGSIVQKLANIFPFINPLDFSTLLDNKRFLPFLAPFYTKKQINILNKKNIEEIALLKSNRVIIKPATLSRGRDIHILNKKETCEFISKSTIPYSWIVQEFINSKNGIPNIMKGTHDLRVIMIDNEISHTYYRQPPKDSLLANVSLGGSKTIIDTRDLPDKIIEIVNYINNLFSVFENKHYSIDLMFDEKENPWIIEFNSAPGMLFKPEDKKIAIKVYEDLTNIFS
ncbi:MAG: hypothetical protein KAT32_01770 [Candidatus Moranbacteria bacterium]|nr:hypothetical protein [Candidatus Moranbacteria bacterium]